VYNESVIRPCRYNNITCLNFCHSAIIRMDVTTQGFRDLDKTCRHPTLVCCTGILARSSSSPSSLLHRLNLHRFHGTRRATAVNNNLVDAGLISVPFWNRIEYVRSIGASSSALGQSPERNSSTLGVPSSSTACGARKLHGVYTLSLPCMHECNFRWHRQSSGQ
jgi:hypothetical protein